MTDDDFFLSLPTDPDEAFPIFEERVRVQFLERVNRDEESGDYWERKYLTQILAFADYFKIDLGIDPGLPWTSDRFWPHYSEARIRIEYYVTQTRLRISYRRKAGHSAIFVLDPALKMEIRHYIEQIKRLIESLALTPLKRDTLMGKLNAFEAEVDRERTRLDAAMAAWVWVKREIKDGTEILGPVLDKINTMLDKFTKATDLPNALPPPTRGGNLEAPPKRIDPPKRPSIADELDDDIPF